MKYKKLNYYTEAAANRGPLPTSANPKSSYTLRNRTIFSCINHQNVKYSGEFKQNDYNND